MVISLKNDTINWDDPILQRWIGAITNQSTMKNCKSAFRIYSQYTKKTATQLIDEAIEDSRRDPRQKQDIVLKQLIGFYNWLKTDYVRRKRLGKTGNTVQDTSRKITGGSAVMRVNVIRGFYGTYDITVRMKGRNKLPRSKVENKRMIFKPEDVWKVKVLVDNARSPRDRAIILCHFQGGLDSSTICDLDFVDVDEGIAKDEHPLKIQPSRVKTGVEFYTFVGKDAKDALRAYIADMKSRGVQFNNRTPLFMQEKSKKRLRGINISTMMKEVAVRSGFVTENNNGNDFNPLGTHSLRESFGSLMINSGVPDTIVDFWLGHAIGDMAEAYKSVQFESLRKMYLEREKLLSITTPALDEKQIAQAVETKVSSKVDERIVGVERLISKFAAENIALKKEVECKSDEMIRLVLNLKPLLDNMDEITEFLKERAWQKEQKIRVEAEREEQEERREISKSEKL